MSDPNDDSIPVLHEILVAGNPTQARREPMTTAPAPQPARDPEAAQEPFFAPDVAPDFRSEPKIAPAPLHAVESVPVADAAHAHDAAHAKRRLRSRAHPHAEPVEPSYDQEAALTSPGVFDRAEPLAPAEAGAIVPPDVAHETPHETPHADANLDADVIAERLRGRFATFLTGEGRGMVEARCRDALQDHTTWLVSQITREVALALETEMTGWVREAVKEAVKEENARRTGRE